MRWFTARLRFATPRTVPAAPDPMSLVLPAASAAVPSADDAALGVLAAALDQRDPGTGAHCDRVGQLAALVGTHCDLDRRALGDLALAARFHDVGKIGIPDDVLLASRDLGAEDWDVMRTHVVRGERLFLATAREDAGRVARLIELDPKYADVIVRRWQDWTGKQATRAADGLAFDQATSSSSTISQ